MFYLLSKRETEKSLNQSKLAINIHSQDSSPFSYSCISDLFRIQPWVVFVHLSIIDGSHVGGRDAKILIYLLKVLLQYLVYITSYFGYQ